MESGHVIHTDSEVNGIIYRVIQVFFLIVNKCKCASVRTRLYLGIF